MDANSNIIKRFPPPIVLNQIKEANVIPLILEPELIHATMDTVSQDLEKVDQLNENMGYFDS